MRYRIRYHVLARRDLLVIGDGIADYAGSAVATRKMREIAGTIRRLEEVPHIGSLHDDILPGLRAIPAGQKAVVSFVVDDETREVLIYTVTYGGADWVGRSRARRN